MLPGHGIELRVGRGTAQSEASEHGTMKPLTGTIGESWLGDSGWHRCGIGTKQGLGLGSDSRWWVTNQAQLPIVHGLGAIGDSERDVLG